MNRVEVKVAIRDTDFVGLKIKNDNIKIIFPIGYDIEENTYVFSNEMEMKNLSDDFSNLMKVLENAPTGYSTDYIEKKMILQDKKIEEKSTGKKQ